MTDQNRISTMARRARFVRAALSRLVASRGRHGGRLLQRIAHTVGSVRLATYAGPVMATAYTHLFLSVRLNDLSDCGTGQAGGGGGGSGLA